MSQLLFRVMSSSVTIPVQLVSAMRPHMGSGMWLLSQTHLAPAFHGAALQNVSVSSSFTGPAGQQPVTSSCCSTSGCDNRQTQVSSAPGSSSLVSTSSQTGSWSSSSSSTCSSAPTPSHHMFSGRPGFMRRASALLGPCQQAPAAARGMRGVTTWEARGGAPLGPPAFVFDIDGVLVRGRHVLPAALEAVKKLSTGGRWRYPVCFMTNGGGVCEARKAAELSDKLGVRVREGQVILSHTPMRDLVPELGDRPVLVAGRGDVLAVARGYGFKHALSTWQLGRAMPPATPFSHYQARPPRESEGGPCPVTEGGLGSEAHPLEAVLVMTDPDDWARDLQLLTDVVLTHGVPTRVEGPPPGSKPVQVYFSNPDLLWANDFPRNRFGQGAFAEALHAVHARLAAAAAAAAAAGRQAAAGAQAAGGSTPASAQALGGDLGEAGQHVQGGAAGVPPLRAKFFGKPNPEPYRLAERLLLQQAQELGLLDEAAAGSSRHQAAGSTPGALPFSGIYAVGDNPAADVRGANAAGPPWVSVLVRTGVFKGPGPNCVVDSAHVVVDDVAGAVEAALHRTRSARFHSMR